MPPQEWIFYLYLVLSAVIAGVFFWVASTTRRPAVVQPEKANRLRFAFFVLLTLVLVSALGLTLSRVPYELWEGEVPDQVIFVAGKQFAFAVSSEPVLDDSDWQEGTVSGGVETLVGDLVEFRVSTLDVNHSMGIFDPDGVLIGQVQAMPGYLNRLRVRLDRPGRYNLLCLELCGMGHARMRGVVFARE